MREETEHKSRIWNVQKGNHVDKSGTIIFGKKQSSTSAETNKKGRQKADKRSKS